MSLSHYQRERMESHARRLRRLSEGSLLGDTLKTSATYIEQLLQALREAESERDGR